MTLFAKSTTLLWLGCVLICCTATTATAQDAETVFRRCVNQLNQISERVTDAQKQTLRECVPRIRRLIENGNIVEARHLAHRCLAKLDSITESGVTALRQSCQPCLRILRELGANELAERLSNRCAEHARAMIQQNQRAKNIINGLFDFGPK